MASKDSDFKKLEDAVEVLHRLSSNTEKIDAGLWRAASDFAKAISPTANIGDPDKLFKSIEEKTDTLIKFGRLQSRLKKANKVASEIAPKSPPAAMKGKGALSDSQVWERLGWKDIGGGRSMWTRPTNAEGVTEHFPPQVSRFIAQYAENEEAMTKATAIDPDSPMLPVTMEQAKEMRRVDAIRDKENEQRENVRVAMMDDYSRFIYENTDRYGKSGAEMVFRQKLMKELPSFFKDSKLSTKQLIAIQKSLASIKSTPIIGRTLGEMIKNPIAGISAMALAGTASVFNVSDKANKSVVSWKNAINLYGLPNKRFYDAALLAGVSNPGDIAELYGKLVEQYGDPEAVLPAFGAMFAGMGKREKTLAAKSIPGLDPTTVAIIDILSGNLKPDKTRTTTALRTKIENTKEFGFRTGATLGQFAQSLWLSLQAGAQARDASNFKYIREGVEENFNEVLDDVKIDDATGAAESLDEAERQGDTTMNSNVRNSEVNVTMNIWTDNPKALSEKFYEIVNGDNRGRLATSGNYVLA